MDRLADTIANDVRLGDTVPVIIGAGADEARRVLGPTAWCALEVLATTPLDDGDADAWIVASSVRTLAGRLGAAVNTAQRALAALRRAGIVEPVQNRRESGRFGPSAYRLNVDPGVLSREPQVRRAGSDPAIPPRRIAAKSPEAAQVSVEFGQQLVLLPS